MPLSRIRTHGPRVLSEPKTVHALDRAATVIGLFGTKIQISVFCEQDWK
jgi:hypothetical protein